jgi:hypothetical protein
MAFRLPDNSIYLCKIWPSGERDDAPESNTEDLKYFLSPGAK